MCHRSVPTLPKSTCVLGSKLECHRGGWFREKLNAALHNELLHVTKTQPKPEVQPCAVSDNLGWKTVAAIGRRRLGSSVHPFIASCLLRICHTVYFLGQSKRLRKRLLRIIV